MHQIHSKNIFKVIRTCQFTCQYHHSAAPHQIIQQHSKLTELASPDLMSEIQSFTVDAWMENDRHSSGTFVPVSEPRQLGCWTKRSVLEGGHVLYGDRSGLLPYQQPRTPSDLNHGYPHAFTRDPPTAKSGVERIILGALACQANLALAGVVTFRNNLNKIAGTALSQSDPWIINAVYLPPSQLPNEQQADSLGALSGPEHNTNSKPHTDSTAATGTLFLDIAKMEEREYANMDLYNYYGYKFESLCTGAPGLSSSSGDAKGSEPEPVDASSEFAAILGLKLGRHRVLLAAEMDCHMDATATTAAAGSSGLQGDSQPAYVELKTFVIPRHKAAEVRLAKDKYPKWWIQSFLAGVPTLVAGGRTTEGKLEEVRKIPVHKLPAMAASAGQPFDCMRVMRFSEAVLSWMTESAQSAKGKQLRFEYLPSAARITCQITDDGDLPGRIRAALSRE